MHVCMYYRKKSYLIKYFLKKEVFFHLNHFGLKNILESDILQSTI